MTKLIDRLAGLVVLIAAGRSLVGRSKPDGTVYDAPQRQRPDGMAPSIAEEQPTWRYVFDYVRASFKNDSLSTHAAAMTYYGILALFPALIATVSLYGLLADPAEIQAQLDSIANVLPESAASLIEEQLSDIVGASGAGLGIGLAISILAALWTASSGVGALIKAVNKVHDATETRKFVALRLLAIAFTVGIVSFVIVSVFSVTALPAVLDWIGLSPGTASVIVWMRWPALGVALMVGVGVLYRFAPNRETKWRWVSIGAVTATVLWLVASLGLNIYVSNFASYNETYGTLGGVIVLLLWIYVSALIVLIGGEIDVALDERNASVPA